jgi:outer membrane protein assembly factor BamB
MRTLLLTLASLTLGGAAFAQSKSTYSRAVPPSKEALERLNLKSDWSVTIPMSGQADSLANVQVLDEDQIAVQTKAGLLVLLDEQTGRTQWTYKYPAAFSSGFGVAVNQKFLFAVNVAKLYCFHRYTGLLEFEFDLPEAPAASPIADGTQIYMAFTGSKMMTFQLPLSLQINAAPVGNAPGLKSANTVVRNPADIVADRYSTRVNTRTIADDEFDRRNVPKAYFESGQGLSTQQKSPSISAMPSVVPPYTIHGLNKVESLSILPSLRQPYKLKPDSLTYNQYSPSLAVIPPSIARVHELSNLRPQGIRPTMAWSIGTKQRITSDPVLVEPKSQLTAPRVWITEAGKNFVALSQRTGASEVTGDFNSEPVGPLVGPFAYSQDALLGFIALDDGQVAAIDLTGGSAGLPRYEWKANVGGFLNHRPIAAKDGVYVSGDHAGVAKIDVKSGDVTWRTESGADRLLAVNDEFVYVTNRRGELLVYAKDRIHDAATKRAKPLTALDVSGFDVSIPNPMTDRVLLGSDSGLIVCLHNASAKYAKPTRIAPKEKLPEPVKPPVKPVEPVPPTPVPPPKN